jgi:pyridoxal phosphate enzyme (YggS family)
MINTNLIQSLKTKFPHVKVIGVTKTRDLETIDKLIRAGIKNIGENRIQEAQGKLPQIEPGIEKHLIGHLQQNKAKQAVALFDMIQSIDSLRIAKKVDREAGKIKKTIPVLIQVNIAEDPDKFGFKVDEIDEALIQLHQMTNLKIKGVMTIVPYYEDPEQARPNFRKLKSLLKTAQSRYPEMTELSMGMSNDYQVAIAEGATMVRIGRALFSDV